MAPPFGFGCTCAFPSADADGLRWLLLFEHDLGIGVGGGLPWFPPCFSCTCAFAGATPSELRWFLLFELYLGIVALVLDSHGSIPFVSEVLARFCRHHGVHWFLLFEHDLGIASSVACLPWFHPPLCSLHLRISRRRRPLSTLASLV